MVLANWVFTGNTGFFFSQKMLANPCTVHNPIYIYIYIWVQKLSKDYIVCRSTTLTK